METRDGFSEREDMTERTGKQANRTGDDRHDMIIKKLYRIGNGDFSIQ
jgi:hypothetical protein